MLPGTMPLGGSGSSTQVINLSVSSNTANYNVKTAAISAGWDGSSDVVVTVAIAAGVEITSSSTSAYAFDTGAFGSPLKSLTITVGSGAYIVGKGGAGGAGGDAPGEAGTNAGSAGGAGGPAFRAQDVCTLINNGTIAGGGNGGTGGRGAAEASGP